MAERSRPTVALGLVGLIIAGLSLRNVPSVAQENPTTTGQAIVSVVTSTTQTSQVPAATNPPGTGLPTPQVYVKIAIDFIEQTAYRVPAVDWPAIRAKAEQQASNAASIEATYPIIAEALKALNDKHSSFTKPVAAAQQTSGKYTGFGFLAVWPSRVVVTVTAGSPCLRLAVRTRRD